MSRTSAAARAASDARPAAAPAVPCRRVRRATRLAAGLLAASAIVPAVAAAQGASRPARAVGPLPVPATVAERSGYTATASHAQVLAFLDTLLAQDAPLVVTELGTTTEGRTLPLVIASRPVVRTPAEARALGRPVAYVQANIHAGEVEGKEAVLALLRDLSQADGPTLLDSLVLLVVPNYNADGNDAFGPVARQRSAQHGPDSVGTRANAMGLDLNRDYVKAEAPETRASLEAFAAWEPELFMDLHTTNGAYHGYHLTYAPSLHPGSPLTPYVRDTLLVAVGERLRERHGVRVFPYGNFGRVYGGDDKADTIKSGWYTYDHRPRFGTNYYGLRGGLSVLSEAFSHDPFEVRVWSTYRFVHAVLSAVAADADGVRARVAAAKAASTFGPGRTPAYPLRSRYTSTPDTQAVLVEVLARLADSTAQVEPGMLRGFARTGRFAAVRMPIVDRFEASLERPAPAIGWVVDPAVADSVIPRLRMHGAPVRRLEVPLAARTERFVVDSVARARRPFQGHREVTLAGRWEAGDERVPAGWWFVPTGAPSDRVAMLLLEPQSDDGLVTWNGLDAGLAAGRPAPVRRVLATMEP